MINDTINAHHFQPVRIHKGLCMCVSTCRTVCTVPLIDYIDGNEYTMEPQQGGDEDGLARGAWDWSLLWKRVPLSQKEKATRKYTTEPYRYISKACENSPLIFFCLHLPFLDPYPSCSLLSWLVSSTPPPLLYVFVLFCSAICVCPPFHFLCDIFLFPSVCLVCMSPHPLCQNCLYGASDRLHPRPEVQHRAPRWRRRERFC